MIANRIAPDLAAEAKRLGTLLPRRVQRARSRGWKKPANTVCVTRGTYWGNQFVVRPDLDAGTRLGSLINSYVAVPTARDAVECYRFFLDDFSSLKGAAIKNLRGKNLACWCALCADHKDGKPLGVQCEACAPCHADVLLELANAPEAR